MLDARSKAADNVHLILDATGRLVTWSRKAEHLWGIPATEAIGLPLTKFLVIESPQRPTVSQNHKVCPAHWNTGTGICKNGEKVILTIFSWPLPGSDSRTALILHHALGQQGHKLSDENEERYRAIFDQAAIGIVHIGTDGTILRTNARLASILGYRAEELAGRNTAQFTAPEFAEKSLTAFRQVLSGALSSADLETKILHKNGSALWCKITFSAQYDHCGVPNRLIGFVENISERKATEQRLNNIREQLSNSEARYRLIFENSIDAIAITRIRDNRYLDSNPAFFTILGYNHVEAVGNTPFDLDVWTERQDRKRMIEEVLHNSICANFETRFRKKDGTLIWGQISASRIDINGEACILSITRDITAAKDARILLAGATEQIRASEERYSAVFRSSSDSIFIIRIDTAEIIDANPTFFEQMGYRRREVIGKTTVELCLWDDLQTRETWLHLLKQSTTCRGFEARFRKRNGGLLWVLLSAAVVEIDNTPCQIVIARDISASKAAEEEIRKLAFYDPLTGLPNRRLLIERLQQALRSGFRTGRSRALLFIDLDNFKILNDTLGHQSGDALLCEVAHRLSGTIRKSDTVARLGGDEFVVMLVDLSAKTETAGVQARIAARKILAELSRPYQLNGRECLSSCSVGIALFGDQPIEAEEILQQADIAMYKAKTSGRNTFRFFEPALQAAVSARAAVEEELHQGLQNKEFTLFFQPQVQRKRLMAAECLLRWNHPKHGLLTPAKFISIAEDSGLILPLGDFVLKRACALISAWSRKREMRDLSVAVNISSVQIRQSNFVSTVLSALEQAGANPEHLTLELTESVLVDNMDDVASKMIQLKAHGIHFSLDDFGTGYSCLAYLKRLPLDQIKIDRAFVRDLLTDKTSGAIAQTIIALCHAMDLTVLAEGVETAEQRDALTAYGCFCFQGFFFGHPVSRLDFEHSWRGKASLEHEA